MIVLTATTPSVPAVISGWTAEIAYSNPATGIFLGSPGLALDGSGNMLCAFDNFDNFSSGAAHTDGVDWDRSHVYRSTDGGASWSALVSPLDGIFWPKFLPPTGDGNLYMMGTARHLGAIVIAQSDGSGTAWSMHTIIPYGGASGAYATAPVPSIISGGRIYVAFERALTATYPIKHAFLLHASITDDLTDPESWTKTNEVTAPSGSDWLEGNVVETPTGGIELWMRINQTPDVGKTARLTYSGGILSYGGSLMDFPQGYVKFWIERCPNTGIYLCAGNVTQAAGTDDRTNLIIRWSRDLTTWTDLITIKNVSTNLRASTGYQYPSMLFEGTTLHIVVRTAEDGANNFHDSNKITYVKVPNYLALLNNL